MARTTLPPDSMIAAVRQKEPAAQEQVMQLIRSFARHVCGVRVAGEAPELDWEDVAQDASLWFFSVGIHRYEERGSERSYLYSVVQSAYLRLWRSAWRRRKREQVGKAHSESVSDPEVKTYVYRLLSRMPEVCQHVLQRLYFDGATYTELASELNLAESSVRARVSRCLRRAQEVVRQHAE